MDFSKWAEELDVNLGRFFDDQRDVLPLTHSNSSISTICINQASDEFHDAIVEQCKRVRQVLQENVYLLKAHTPHPLYIGESRYIDNPQGNDTLRRLTGNDFRYADLNMQLTVSNLSTFTACLSLTKALETFLYIIFINSNRLGILSENVKLLKNANALIFSFSNGVFVSLQLVAGKHVIFQNSDSDSVSAMSQVSSGEVAL